MFDKCSSYCVLLLRLKLHTDSQTHSHLCCEAMSKTVTSDSFVHFRCLNSFFYGSLYLCRMQMMSTLNS